MLWTASIAAIYATRVFNHCALPNSLGAVWPSAVGRERKPRGAGPYHSMRLGPLNSRNALGRYDNG